MDDSKAQILKDLPLHLRRQQSPTGLTVRYWHEKTDLLNEQRHCVPTGFMQRGVLKSVGPNRSKVRCCTDLSHLRDIQKGEFNET